MNPCQLCGLVHPGDHPTVPLGRKTNRRRGWRITLLRRLAKSSRSFKPSELLQLCDGMTRMQAQALCRHYRARGELRLIKKGSPGHTESTYAAAQ